MSKRSRWIGFGSAGLLVLAGGILAAVVGDETGRVLAFGLIGIGLVALMSLVFLEVGLTEDRDRAEELTPAHQHDADWVIPLAPKPAAPVAPARLAHRPRLDRMRGHTRRVR